MIAFCIDHKKLSTYEQLLTVTGPSSLNGFCARQRAAKEGW